MRVLTAAGLLVVGAGTGVATVALHDLWWGLTLAAVTTLLVVAALPPGWWSRLAFVVGWDAVVGWLTLPRADGGYLISQDLPGYAVLGLGLLLLVVGVGTLPPPRSRREA